MYLQVEELHSFVVLADELHFGRASKRLFVSQPALSKQIRRLEEKVGGALFTRTRRKVEITEAGRVLPAGANKVLREDDAALSLAREASESPLFPRYCHAPSCAFEKLTPRSNSKCAICRPLRRSLLWLREILTSGLSDYLLPIQNSTVCRFFTSSWWSQLSARCRTTRDKDWLFCETSLLCFSPGRLLLLCTITYSVCAVGRVFSEHRSGGQRTFYHPKSGPRGTRSVSGPQRREANGRSRSAVPRPRRAGGRMADWYRLESALRQAELISRFVATTRSVVRRESLRDLHVGGVTCEF
jgi:hypothetical protein